MEMEYCGIFPQKLNVTRGSQEGVGMIMWDYNMMNCQFEFKNIRRDLKLNLSRRRVYSTGWLWLWGRGIRKEQIRSPFVLLLLV